MVKGKADNAASAGQPTENVSQVGYAPTPAIPLADLTRFPLLEIFHPASR